MWSNLVLEAWQLRERQGGEGALNPRHKKKKRDIPFHLSVMGVGSGDAPSIHGGQVLS